MSTEERAADDDAPRPLEDEELEAVAGGNPNWCITFNCCGEWYVFSRATSAAAVSAAISLHNQVYSHTAGSYSVVQDSPD